MAIKQFRVFLVSDYTEPIIYSKDYYYGDYISPIFNFSLPANVIPQVVVNNLVNVRFGRSYSVPGGKLPLMQTRLQYSTPEQRLLIFESYNTGYNYGTSIPYEPKYGFPSSVDWDVAKPIDCIITLTGGDSHNVAFNTDKALTDGVEYEPRPYLLFEYNEYTPYVDGLTPVNTTVDSRGDIVLRWNHNTFDGGVQTSFVLQYSNNDGETWEAITETTSRESYTIPANTFTGEETIIWRIKTVDSAENLETEYVEATFITGQTVQRPPVITTPFGEYLDVADNIDLEWIFMGHPGEFQSKYEVNWSRNGGLTWFEIINESSNNYHVVLGNSFSTGTITWRIRTWNNYNEVSPWSEVKSFHLIGRPATPVITDVSNNTKPTVKWTADAQQIYELEILQGSTLVYSSGRVASVSTFQHHVDKYLANGSYRVRLRVKNVYDLWSNYGERNFIINRDNPPAPNITVESGEYKVVVRATGLSDKSYVYRDDLLLGEMINGLYEDYTGVNNKEYDYFVRTINEEENFSDSVNGKGKCSFKGNTLALEREPSNFLLLKYNLSSKPTKSIDIRNIGSSMQFDGRDYPVFEFSNIKTFSKKLGFSINENDLEKVEELLNGRSTMLYRDHFEENIYGVVENASATKALIGYTLEFTIDKNKEV